MERHSEKLKKNAGLAHIGIALTSVSFSLWRAVFLADRTDVEEATFSDALKFLELLISDNAISYAQDKLTREWTFVYYINNARARLVALAESSPDILPNFVEAPGWDAKPDWENLQLTADLAVRNYENKLRTVKK
jgi:hypothetical protein